MRGLLFKKETFGDLELKVAIKFYNLYLSVEGSSLPTLLPFNNSVTK